VAVRSTTFKEQRRRLRWSRKSKWSSWCGFHSVGLAELGVKLELKTSTLALMGMSEPSLFIFPVCLAFCRYIGQGESASLFVPATA